MKKILLITAFSPSEMTAGQNYTKSLYEDLINNGYIVDIVSFGAPDSVVENNENIYHSLTTFRRILNCILMPIFHPIFSSRFNIRILMQLLLIQKNYDVILFNYSQIMLYSLFLRNVRTIFIAHDVVQQIYSRKKGFFYKLMHKWVVLNENFILKKYSGKIFCFSYKDADKIYLINSVHPEVTSFYLDKRALEIVHQPQDYFTAFGAWGRVENYNGLIWFFKNVLPLLPNSFKLKIIGGGLKEEFKALIPDRFRDRIEILGFVDNPYPILAKSKALLAPLFEGAGVKVKVIDALTIGLPVIGTDVAFEGVHISYLRNCCLVNDSESFIEGINSMVWRVGSEHDKRHFIRSYSRNSILSSVNELF